MSVYVYCVKEDYRYQSSIKGRAFDSEWFQLEEDGTVIVKGSNKEGYAWDGCSPKIKIKDVIKDVYFGTPEAVLNFETGNSKTYYASLIHDVFYQFSTDLKSFISRKEVDREFYIILKENKFRFAKLYYGVVRLLGWLFW
ncbi:MAG: hypothetical protein ACYSUP_06645 [Planctomycetota bacterium]